MSRIVRHLDTVPAPGLFTRRQSGGGFPSSPLDPRWRGTVAQWAAVKAVADAHPGTPGMGGWTVETQGFYPGAGRMLAYWAAAPVTAVTVVHTGTAAGLGMVPTLYAAAAAGAALIVRGAYVTLQAQARADAAARAARHDHEYDEYDEYGYGDELVPFHPSDVTEDLALDDEPARLDPASPAVAAGGRLRLVHDDRWQDRPGRPVRPVRVEDDVLLAAAEAAPVNRATAGRRGRRGARGGRR